MQYIFFAIMILTVNIYADTITKVDNINSIKRDINLSMSNDTIKPSEQEIKKLIGNMLMIGFYGEDISKNSKIIQNIEKYHISGVILFDKNPNNKNKVKNIKSPKQLAKLTKKLQSFTSHYILIATDQEGGLVSRLKKSNNFHTIPGARTISKKNNTGFAKLTYATLANDLATNGINCDFAPVVDLAINKNNNVIVRVGRSYGKSPKKVIKFAKIFIEELNKKGIISVLKHFPGHGSSLRDSHYGFVDISKTWDKVELQPYVYFIKHGLVDIIMTAHVFNSNLDNKYPASLSYKVNTELLRKKMAYHGVIITDDLQMKAITKKYSLKEVATLAINAGVDILLFANQLDKELDVDKFIDIVYHQIIEHKIPLSKIVNANQRIISLIEKYKN